METGSKVTEGEKANVYGKARQEGAGVEVRKTVLNQHVRLTHAVALSYQGRHLPHMFLYKAAKSTSLVERGLGYVRQNLRRDRRPRQRRRDRSTTITEDHAMASGAGCKHYDRLMVKDNAGGEAVCRCPNSSSGVHGRKGLFAIMCRSVRLEPKNRCGGSCWDWL